MKKKLLFVFVVSLILSSFFCAAAFADSLENDEYRYEINDDGETCKITSYKGNSRNVVIPSEIDGYPVTHIGSRTSNVSGAFFYSNLNSVVIPDTVQIIDGSAFGYNNLTSIEIPASVTIVADSAFSHNNISTVTFSEGLIEIGEFVFYDNKLTDVVLPNSVESIGKYAFFNNDIKSLTYNTQTTQIGNSAFNLNKISLINGVESTGLILDSTATKAVSYGGTSKTIDFIPNTVTVIGEGAFLGDYDNPQKGIRSLTFPDSVVRIEDSAFAYNNLSRVVLPPELIYIGRSAFGKNESLKYLTLPQSNHQWIRTDDTIYSGGDRITELWRSIQAIVPVTLTEDLCRIDDNGDGTCSVGRYEGDSVSLVIPEQLAGLTVTGIDSGFSRKNFVELHLPDTITYIDSGAFNSNNITTLNGNPFDGIFYAKNPHGTDDLTTIVSYGGPSKVIDFIPSTVTTIGRSAFYGCDIESVVLPDSITTIGSTAFSNNELESVTLPAGLRHIEYGVFESNRDLAEVNFPEGLLTIGYRAFYATDFKSITLPNSLIYIDRVAFSSKTDVKLPNNGTLWYALDSDEDIAALADGNKYSSAYEYAAQIDYSLLAPEDIFVVEDLQNGTCKVTDIYAYNTDLVIPSAINNKAVTFVAPLPIENNFIKSVTFPDTVTSVQLGRHDESWYVDEVANILPEVAEGWTFIDNYSFKGYLSNKPVMPAESEFMIIDYGNGTCRIDEYTGKNANIILPTQINSLQVIDINLNGLKMSIGRYDDIDLYGATFPDSEQNWTNGYGKEYESGVFTLSNAFIEDVVFLDAPRLLASINVEIADNGDGTCTIEKYLSAYKDIVIPDTIDELTVTAIADKAFMGKGIIKVQIPSSVTSIGIKAFASNKITEIVLSDNLSYIGDLAFNNNMITTINSVASDGLIYARNEDGTEDKSTIVSYCGSAEIIDFIPSSVTTIKADVFSSGNIIQVNLTSGGKGWRDSNGEMYLFNREVEDKSLEYTTNDKLPIGYFFSRIWNGITGFVLKIVRNPIMLTLISVIVFLVLLIRLVVKNAKLRKKYRNADIEKKEYKKTKRLRMLIFILILALVFAFVGYMIIFESDGASFSFNSENTDETVSEYSPEPEDDLITLEISEGNLSEIEDRTDLQRLVVYQSVTGDLSSLSGLVNLEELTIHDFKYGREEDEIITGDITSLSALNKLRILELDSCEEITGDLSSLVEMTNLEIIELDETSKITGDLGVFNLMPKLTSLDISWNSSVTGDLSAFSELANLQVLNLSYNKNVTGNLGQLSFLSELKELDLSRCENITGELEALSLMDKMEALSLGRMEQIYGDLSDLSHMTNMIKLDVGASENISGSLTSLSQMTELERLDIDRCDLIEINLADLKPFVKLKTLRINIRSNSGSLRDIAGLVNLSDLRISCSEGSYDISYLGELGNMNWLDISGAGFTGDVSSLNSLTHVRWLSLNNCSNITGDIGTLTGLTNLYSFDIYNCENLTGVLVVNGETITPNS